jgi:hypothetical protein
MPLIVENQHVFWPAAQHQYQALGRGTIVVDTTVRPTGVGHPFTYYTQAQINKARDRDAQCMVREYDPIAEMVVALLKSKERVSVYRIRMMQP